MQSLTYSEFIGIIFSIFSHFFNWLYELASSLMNNFLFITILYITLLFFIYYLFLIVIDIIKNIYLKLTKKEKREVE